MGARRPPAPGSALRPPPPSAQDAASARMAFADHHGISLELVTDAMVSDSALGVQGWAAHMLPGASSAVAAVVGPAADGQLPQGLVSALSQQAQAMTQLLQRMGNRDDTMALLAGSPGSEDQALTRLPGARGAAVRELHRREFESRPGMYSQRVAENIARARDGPWVNPDRQTSAQEFFAEMVPFPPSARLLVHLSFGIARAFDQSRAGQHLQVQDTLARLLVASEQIARDGGELRLAWLLTHLPDPPWSRLLSPGMQGQHTDFALLSDPAWVASAIAYMKDVESVAALRKAPPLRGAIEERPPKVPKKPQGPKGPKGGEPPGPKGPKGGGPLAK